MRRDLMILYRRRCANDLVHGEERGRGGIEIAIERLGWTSRGMAFWHGRERDLLKISTTIL